MKAKLLLPLLLVLHLLVACEPITSSNKEYVEYIVRNHTAILNYALQKCNNVNRNFYYNTFASLCDLSVQDEFAAHIEKASEVSLDVLSESYALAIEDGLCEVPNDPALVPYIGRAFDKLLKDENYETRDLLEEFRNVYYGISVVLSDYVEVSENVWMVDELNTGIKYYVKSDGKYVDVTDKLETTNEYLNKNLVQ
jgi:hypothetical protein